MGVLDRLWISFLIGAVGALLRLVIIVSSAALRLIWLALKSILGFFAYSFGMFLSILRGDDGPGQAEAEHEELMAMIESGEIRVLTIDQVIAEHDAKVEGKA